MSRRTLGALAGMLGASVFVCVFLIEGALRPGYDPVSMFVSELSLGPRGWIQITSFLITGICYMLFAWGLAAVFNERKSARLGWILIGLIGIGFLISGPAVMDPTGTPTASMTVSGLVHSITGALVFLLMPLSAYVFLHRFRGDERWRSLRTPTLAAVIIMVIAVIALRFASPPPPAETFLTPYDGFIQRVLLIAFHAWAFLFAWRIYNKRELPNT
jgi:hypothetical protein